MKTMENSGRRSENSLFRSAGNLPTETAVFVTLGLAALLAMIVAAQFASVGQGRDPLAIRGRSPVASYIHSGQLVADARTMLAMVHYLMEPETPVVTNVGGPVLTQKDLAIPTNNAARARKA